jgi:diguanylate cyclase (GGDEF)-like protein
VALYRRRRATEVVGFVGGALGFVPTVGLWFVRGSLPPSLAATTTWSISLFAPLCLAICLASWGGLRTVSTRWYPVLNVSRVVLDVVAILAAVCVVSDAARSTTVTLLAIPVLSGAIRLGLAGAIASWGVTFAGYAAISLVLASRHELSAGVGIQSPLAVFLLAALFGFLTAIVTGGQTRSVNQHIAALETARSALQYQATHDALTGLATRSVLYTQAPLMAGGGALLAIDLDGFKAINDSHGHAAGDAVLRAVAVRLQAAVSSEDLVVRMGGDEFVVLLPGADEPAAEVVAAQLRAELAKPIGIFGDTVSIGGSIGVALAASQGGWDVDALAARADARMYAAKATRKAAPLRPLLSSVGAAAGGP